MMNMDPAVVERAKLTAKGMAQFELMHAPDEYEDTNASPPRKIVVCKECGVDFPCNRMITFMVVQGLATIHAAFATASGGGMANIIGRFAGGNK